MQYTVEELSPIKRKVQVDVPAAEVNAALNALAGRYRQTVSFPGFRKGKAPLAMVEKRFAQDIYSEATSELINANIASILKELDHDPLTGVELDGQPLSRDKDFSYSFTYEIMPVFEVPSYEGIEVEQEKAVVTDEEVDQVIDRVRKGMATRVDVSDVRLPKDGDMVTMDFAGTDEDGKAIDGVSGDNFQVSIGEGQVIPDFEKLVCSIKPGDTSEGPVVFPADYRREDLAGKTVTMKITVHKIQEQQLPEINDEFAKTVGGFDDVASMRENIISSYKNNRQDMAKSKAQSTLLDSLLEKVSFPLPETLVERYTGNILNEQMGRLERQGQDPAKVAEEELEKMRGEARTEAEKFAKTQLFLLTVAKNENVEATPQEMEAALRQVASRGNHSLKEVHEYYMQHNLMPALRDRILADKAMDAIYAKATVKEIDAKPES